MGHFTVVYLVAKPSIWSEAEGDLVVLEISKVHKVHLKSSKVCIIPRSPLASLLLKSLATKCTTVKWTIKYVSLDHL